MSTQTEQMQGVKRYDVTTDGHYDTGFYGVMEDSDIGDYVLFDDYQKVRSLLDAAMAWVRSDTESPSAEAIRASYAELPANAMEGR